MLISHNDQRRFDMALAIYLFIAFTTPFMVTWWLISLAGIVWHWRTSGIRKGMQFQNVGAVVTTTRAATSATDPAGSLPHRDQPAP